MKALIEIKDLSLIYEKEQKTTLSQLSLEIQEGEFISIIGKSGCGKSSLLQMISGMQVPSTGSITIGGSVIKEPIDDLSYVFQRPILLEWKTVLENVLLPIELRRKLTDHDVNQAKEMLALAGLADDIHKFPYECSGGMQARVAIVRALLVKPKILIMDEPFSSLDSFTKDQLHIQLSELIAKDNPTVLFVTHDLQEAFYLSDRVILIGGEPSTILKEYRISFTKPRTKKVLFDRSFHSFQQDIYERLQ